MSLQPQGNQDDDLVEPFVASLLAQPDPMARYQALTRAQGVHEAITKRIAAERARAVADMKDTGMSYAHIAEAIGFTRSRAQQLVERAEPAPAARPKPAKRTAPTQLAEFLEVYLREQQWPREGPRTGPVPPLVAQLYTAEQLSAQLFADPRFRALQLGTWLRTPEAKLIDEAIAALDPQPFRQDVELLADALARAAQLQQKDGRERALAAGVLLAVLLAAAGGRG